MAAERETFESVEWPASTDDRPLSARVAVFVLLCLGLGSWLVWDFLTVGEFGYTVAELEWQATALDWLTLFALAVLVAFGLVPAVRRPDRVLALVARYPRTPGAVLSLAAVLGITVVGVVGPEFVAPPTFNFEQRTQPPLGFTVGQYWTDDCLRPVRGGEACGGTWAAPLGTTRRGHSVVSWLAYGARTTVQFVVVSVTLIAPTAVVVGSVAGYMGGRYDAVLSRVIEFQQTVPTLVIYFLAAVLVGPTLFVLVLVYGLFDWADTAALVRAEARSIRTESYVQAARSAGASRLDVLRSHVVPNLGETVLTSISTLVPKLVLIEALFAFVGLSSVESRSWGRLVWRGLAGDVAAFDQIWWISTLPTVAIGVTVLSASLFGDAVQAVVDGRE